MNDTFQFEIYLGTGSTVHNKEKKLCKLTYFYTQLVHEDKWNHIPFSLSLTIAQN